MTRKIAGLVDRWRRRNRERGAERAQRRRFRESLLEAQSEASFDGILVVSPDGKMISFNRRFVEIWEIPQLVRDSRSDRAALESVLDKIVNPEAFLAKVYYLYEHPEEVSWDEIALKGGGCIERYSAPVKGSDG